MSKKSSAGFKSIYFERTMCYGECPVYTLEISAGGEVRYSGTRFVVQSDFHEWTISSEKIELLNKAILNSGFFTMKKTDSEIQMTCNPSCITAIRLRDNTFRRIEDYLGEECYPKTLRKLERKIDEISGVNEYVGKGA